MMFRWRASLWKTVWRELLIYLLFYLAISLIYRFLLFCERKVPNLSNTRFVLIGQDENGEPATQQMYFEKVQ